MSEFETIKIKIDEKEYEFNYSEKERMVWLTKEDLAALYERDRTVITRHINNLYKNKELIKERTCARHAQVQAEGDRSVVRNVDYYNLEVILKIGEKIKSNTGRQIEKILEKELKEINGNNTDIIIYNNGNINLAVNVSPQEDTVWLNVSQIASLFDSTVQNIYIHIGKIVEEGELEVNSVCKDFLQTPFFLKQIPTVGPDGKTYILDYYNLDMILSVGYRVKSKNAILFRRWSNSVLKQYLLKGYVIDDNRVTVSKENFIELEHDVQRIKQEIIDIKEKVFIEPVKEKLFYAGQFFDAYEFICSLLGKAKKSIDIIDPYFDVDSLIYFQKTNRGIKKTILTSKRTKLSKLNVDIFERQYGHLVIKKNKRIHDRFIILDETICYSIGTSINSHTGGKLFMVSMIEDEDIIKMLLKKLER